MLGKIETYHQYLEQVLDLLNGMTIEMDNSRLLQMKTKLQTTQFFVPVIGEMNSGKSSFLNRFMQQDILPVGIQPETEIATELYYRKDGSSLAGTAIWETVKENSQDNSAIKIYLNNRVLQKIEPLVLVDMLGSNNTLHDHRIVIDDYIARGVYFIVVVSIDEGGLSKSLLNALNHLKKLGKNFCILLNKSDIRSEKEVKEVFDHIRELVSDQFSNNVPVIVLKEKDDFSLLFDVLLKLNINSCIEDLFLNDLKEQTFSVISQINIAKKGFKNDSETNDTEIQELDNERRKLQNRYDSLLQEEQDFDTAHVAKRCTNKVMSTLEKNTIDFAEIAVSSERKYQLSDMIFSTIQDTLYVSLQEQLEYVDNSIADNLSVDISVLNTAIPVDLLYSNIRSHDFRYKVQKILHEILNFIQQVIPIAWSKIIHDYCVEQFSLQFKQDVLPELKKLLERTLIPMLEDEFKHSVSQLRTKFGEELQQKREILAKIEADEQQKMQNSENIIHQLSDVEQKISQLADQVLYTGV